MRNCENLFSFINSGHSQEVNSLLTANKKKKTLASVIFYILMCIYPSAFFYNSTAINYPCEWFNAHLIFYVNGTEEICSMQV